MQKQTKKPQDKGKAPDWETVRMLAIELGAREAARKLKLNENTVLSRAKRDNWNLPKRKGGATLKNATAITLQSKPGDVLIASHKELEQGTRTDLARATRKAAAFAAQTEPVLAFTGSEHISRLSNAASKLFGWDSDKQRGGDTYNQLVVSAEQLALMRQLCDCDSTTQEEREGADRKVVEMTPDDWGEVRRKARELFGGEQNIEHQTVLELPSVPEACEVKIRGDGTGVEVRSNY